MEAVMSVVNGEDNARFGFVDEVRALILSRVTDKSLSETQAQSLAALATGKMLRTRFAARLMRASKSTPDTLAVILNACAATELVHTASLLHDDIIDNATLRRAQPTLWKTQGPNYAVLMGDLVYCEALSILLSENSRYLVPRFVEKVREICVSEISQELTFRQRALNVKTYLNVVRGKTGPLFAFLGNACGGAHAELAAALEEAGYLTGMAYQLIDDVLDASGNEASAGKTLGTDAVRKKATLAGGLQDGSDSPQSLIKTTFASAIALLDKWPDYQSGVAEFFAKDLER
jgi:heptaprenyl diphosphate synthase